VLLCHTNTLETNNNKNNTDYVTDTNDDKFVCEHSFLLVLMFYKHNGYMFM